MNRFSLLSFVLLPLVYRNLQGKYQIEWFSIRVILIVLIASCITNIQVSRENNNNRSLHECLVDSWQVVFQKTQQPICSSLMPALLSSLPLSPQPFSFLPLDLFSSVFAVPMFPFYTTTLALYEPVPGLENKTFYCFLLICLAKPASYLFPKMQFYPIASDSVSTEAAHEVEPTFLSLYSNSF